MGVVLRDTFASDGEGFALPSFFLPMPYLPMKWGLN